MNGRGGARVLCGRWSQHSWAAVRVGWFVEEKNFTVVSRARFWWIGWKMVSSTAAENRSWNLELGGIELCSLQFVESVQHSRGDHNGPREWVCLHHPFLYIVGQ